MTTEENKIITSNLNSEFKRIRESGSNQHGVVNGSAYRPTEEIQQLKKQFRRRVAAAPGNIVHSAPKVQSPFYQRTNSSLPLDRVSRNQWCRYYYRHEPFVRSAIDLHSQFPITDFENTLGDKKIKEFFDYMMFDRLNIMEILYSIGLDFWKIGDVFPMGKYNKSEGIWDKFTLLNPDYVELQTNIFAMDPLITLAPDNDLIQIVQGGPTGPMKELYRQLSQEIIRAVKAGESIPLSSEVVSQLSNKASSYEVWGTSIIQNVFKVLLYKDKLREAQQAIADRFSTPLRIFKIGQPGAPQPTQEELDSFRDLLHELESDPAPVIVYHSELAVEGTDFASRILPLSPEFQWIKEELLVGLGISESVLIGDGPSYGNAEAALAALRRRYLHYRNILTRWIVKKVYEPIARAQEFYKPGYSERFKVKKDRELVIPEVTWHGKDMIDEDAARQFYLELQSRGLMSLQSFYPKFGLDYEEEMQNLQSETKQQETGEFTGGGDSGGMSDLSGLGLDMGAPSGEPAPDLGLIAPDGADRPSGDAGVGAVAPGSEPAPALAKQRVRLKRFGKSRS